MLNSEREKEGGRCTCTLQVTTKKRNVGGVHVLYTWPPKKILSTTQGNSYTQNVFNTKPTILPISFSYYSWNQYHCNKKIV